MSLIRAKYNRFCHSICLLEICGDFVSDLIDSVFYDYVVVIITIVINAIFYLVAVYITLPLIWSPSISDISSDIDNAEWCQKAILYSFFQTVCIYWLTEIVYIRNILGFFRCSCHTYLSGRREVFQYLSPVAILLRRSSVALINYHQIKKVRAKKRSEFDYSVIAFLLTLFIVIAGQLLI